VRDSEQWNGSHNSGERINNLRFADDIDLIEEVIKGHSHEIFTTYFFGPITKIGLFKDFCNIFHQKNMNAYN